MNKLKLFFNNFKKNWFFYLICFGLSFLCWYWIVGIIVEPSDQEKLGVLIDSIELEVPFDDYTKPDYIKEFKTETLDDNGIGIVMMARHTVHAFDVFIVSESCIEKYKNFYAEIDKDIAVSLFGTVDFYDIEDKTYGIKATNALTTYAKNGTLKEDYYIVFASNSYHLGDLKNTELDGAIELVKYLLSKGN